MFQYLRVRIITAVRFSWISSHACRQESFVYWYISLINRDYVASWDDRNIGSRWCSQTTSWGLRKTVFGLVSLSWERGYQTFWMRWIESAARTVGRKAPENRWRSPRLIGERGYGEGASCEPLPSKSLKIHTWNHAFGSIVETCQIYIFAQRI